MTPLDEATFASVGRIFATFAGNGRVGASAPSAVNHRDGRLPRTGSRRCLAYWGPTPPWGGGITDNGPDDGVGHRVAAHHDAAAR